MTAEALSSRRLEPVMPDLGGRRIAALFGSGRCGSTWLGTIVDSHPDVEYRFEPFSYLGTSDPFVKQFMRLVRSDRFAPPDLEFLYDALIRAIPACQRPPYFAKRHGPKLGKQTLHLLSRKSRLARSLFEAIYAPRGRPFLFLKEINHLDVLRGLLDRTGLPIVYLVRHPCAVVASYLQGQSSGVMFLRSDKMVSDFLESHDPEFRERYGPRLPDLSAAQKEAIMWRVVVEKGMRAIRGMEQAQLIIYENFCRDPVAGAQDLFRHIGLEFGKPSRDFVIRSADPRNQKRKHLDPFNNKYFRVFRDPLAQMEKWKKQLSGDQVREVYEAVSDSPEFRKCAELGMWDVPS